MVARYSGGGGGNCSRGTGVFKNYTVLGKCYIICIQYLGMIRNITKQLKINAREEALPFTFILYGRDLHLILQINEN